MQCMCHMLGEGSMPPTSERQCMHSPSTTFHMFHAGCETFEAVYGPAEVGEPSTVEPVLRRLVAVVVCHRDGIRAGLIGMPEAW